jgi:hypothetical protein
MAQRGLQRQPRLLNKQTCPDLPIRKLPIRTRSRQRQKHISPTLLLMATAHLIPPTAVGSLVSTLKLRDYDAPDPSPSLLGYFIELVLWEKSFEHGS